MASEFSLTFDLVAEGASFVLVQNDLFWEEVRGGRLLGLGYRYQSHGKGERSSEAETCRPRRHRRYACGRVKRGRLEPGTRGSGGGGAACRSGENGLVPRRGGAIDLGEQSSGNVTRRREEGWGPSHHHRCKNGFLLPWAQYRRHRGELPPAVSTGILVYGGVKRERRSKEERFCCPAFHRGIRLDQTRKADACLRDEFQTPRWFRFP